MSRDHCILIVDDDTRNREMLAEALRQANFQVELAASGEEAIDNAGFGRFRRWRQFENFREFGRAGTMWLVSDYQQRTALGSPELVLVDFQRPYFRIQC